MSPVETASEPRPTERGLGEPDGPVCPFCKRPVVHLKRHHLVPRSRGGQEKIDSCLDCHRAIHAFFPLKELEARYNTVTALMANDRFRRMVRWIAKQDPTRRQTICRPRDQQKRARHR